jgi:hypothetical protein
MISGKDVLNQLRRTRAVGLDHGVEQFVKPMICIHGDHLFGLGSVKSGVSFSSGNQQMEQGGASLVFLYLNGLAR